MRKITYIIALVVSFQLLPTLGESKEMVGLNNYCFNEIVSEHGIALNLGGTFRSRIGSNSNINLFNFTPINIEVTLYNLLTDSDGDGVPDNIDDCPYVPGYPELNGCTEDIVYRNVIWVHGFHGDETSFTQVAADVTARFKANNKNGDYSATQSSLANAATNLGTDVEDFTGGQYDTERNFIIAHSLGGMVARTLGQITEPITSTPLYNGLITFGTPHQGAFVADTYEFNPQLLNSALTDACVNLAKGPVAEGVSKTGVLGKVAVSFGFSGAILNQACGAGVEYLYYNIIPSYFEQGLEAELTTTAAANVPTMPTDNKAVFYAIEDGHDDGTLTPRFIGALKNEPNSYSLYGADASDAAGIADVDAELTDYLTEKNHWQGLADGCHWPDPFWVCDYRQEVANGYSYGASWFGRLDPTWQELIGSQQTIIEQVGCQCDNYVQGNYESSQVHLGVFDCLSLESYSGNSWTQCDPYLEPVYTVEKDSDGFILAESAIDGPGMNYDAQFMDGSNHLQMRNDSQMELAIDAIFELGLGGTFFITPER